MCSPRARRCCSARLHGTDPDRERVLPAASRCKPADQILIVAPPRADLVGVVADQAGGAELLDRQAMTRRRRGVAQHQLAADVLAGIVAALRAGAGVDQLHGDVGALAVVGDRQPDVVVRRDPPRLRLDLVEPSAVDAPAAVAGSVPNQVVPSPGNVSTCTSLRPAAFARAGHAPDRVVKTGRGGNAVQLREAPDVIVWGRDAHAPPAPSAPRDRAAFRPAPSARPRGERGGQASIRDPEREW